MSREDITSGDLLFKIMEELDVSTLFSSLDHGKHSNSKKSLRADQVSFLTSYYQQLFLLNQRISGKSNAVALNPSYDSKGLGKIKSNIHIRTLLRKVYEQRLQFLSRKLIKTINNRKNFYLLSISQQTTILRKRLNENFEVFDAVALRSTIEYFSVLQSELRKAKQQLIHERNAKDILRKQAQLFKNIQLFNIYLSTETRRSIELQLLSKSSAQFQRCLKAVYDNLGNQNHYVSYHPDLYVRDLESVSPPKERTPVEQKTKKTKGGVPPNLIYKTLTERNLKVLNVFKLKNTHLANNLQKISSKLPNAKMKGLFCCFPSEYLYNFSVFGIKHQYLPSSSSRPSKSSLAQYIDLDQLSPMTPERIFRPFWLFANQPEPLLPLSAEYLDLYQRSHRFAEKLASPSSSLPNLRLRFSKYSMISSINDYSPSQLENGIFLALCRVLIIKQKTISTSITDLEVTEAILQGYDAVFSSKTDEYCLLQEQFVLPEFLIHLSFPSIIDSQIESHAQAEYDREEQRQRQDLWYQHLFPRSDPTSTSTNLPLHRGEGKDRIFKTSLEGRNIHPKQTASELLKNNYFDYVEQLQNEQFAEDLSTSDRHLNQQTTHHHHYHDNTATDSGFNEYELSSSHQRNVTIKQRALLNIENSVTECKLANQRLVQATSKRILQFYNGELQKRATTNKES